MRRTWLSRRAILTHVTLLLVVPAFLALGWWQYTRARSGNTLSWAYTFEWPFFAAYAIAMWWRLIHDQPRGAAGAEVPASPSGEAEGGLPGEHGQVDDVDEELAAYNAYLASLHAADRARGR